MAKKFSMPSQMQHSFSNVPKASIERSVFNRTFSHKTTFDSGYLVPFLLDEILPGDSFKVSSTFLVRLTTPIVPFMDNLHAETFYFFVPYRLLWDDFRKFFGDVEPNTSEEYAIPIIAAPQGGWAAESLGDYFGIPIDVQLTNINAFPFRGYNLIWNEWFRDQNIQDSVVVDKDGGTDDSADYVLLRRGKRHDYFTSCLPYPQKGPDTVRLPLGLVAPVLGIGREAQTWSDSDVSVYETQGTGPVVYDKNYEASVGGSHNGFWVEEDSANAGYPGIYADLANATAATINDLRIGFQAQRFLERAARAGTRYEETVKAHFGVTMPCNILRPEYLGGGKFDIMVNTVAQTDHTPTTGTPQGNLSGFAQGIQTRDGFTKSFFEHGMVIGLICVYADLTYQQGLPKFFSKRDPFDLYIPALAHVGETAVLNKEIFATGISDDDNGVFGYQEAWAEYRYKPSMITGKLRSQYSTSLDYWHLAQEFADCPTLSPTFIEENPPVDRVIAVPSEPQFYMDSFIRMKCVRPMPVYSVPGLIDHF